MSLAGIPRQELVLPLESEPEIRQIERCIFDQVTLNVEDEQDLYPTFDVTSDSWAEELTNSIRRFHAVVAKRKTTEPMLDNPESNT